MVGEADHLAACLDNHEHAMAGLVASSILLWEKCDEVSIPHNFRAYTHFVIRYHRDQVVVKVPSEIPRRRDSAAKECSN